MTWSGQSQMIPRLKRHITTPNIAKWHMGERATLFGQQYVVIDVSCDMVTFHILLTERQITLGRLTSHEPEDFIP